MWHYNVKNVCAAARLQTGSQNQLGTNWVKTWLTRKIGYGLWACGMIEKLSPEVFC